MVVFWVEFWVDGDEGGVVEDDCWEGWRSVVGQRYVGPRVTHARLRVCRGGRGRHGRYLRVCHRCQLEDGTSSQCWLVGQDSKKVYPPEQTKEADVCCHECRWNLSRYMGTGRKKIL
jgi:hypothetical protein